MVWAILAGTICLAYANGANDNFKGVATLFGSETTNYRRALVWATFTTACGSLAAVFMADVLLQNFSGRGLVDDALAASPRYIAAVALGAGLMVLLATRVGMPISTTHGLVGALLGAGWSSGSAVSVEKLASGFFLPLLASPGIAIALTFCCYPLLSWIRRRLGIQQQTCFCMGSEVVQVACELGHVAALERVERLTVSMGTPVTCRSRYHGTLLGFDFGTALDKLHFLSAGIVSFARGLNDTPKIAAMMLVLPHLDGSSSLVSVGVVIALGGLISASRVARLMSQRITPMNHGQGFTANAITGAIVIGASQLGLPVSTTHVSCGSLFGIGLVTRGADWKIVSQILAAWLLTLPAAAILGAAAFWLLGQS